MRPARLPSQSPEQIKALEELYHKTKDVRLRTRAQMMLLAAEKQLVAREIAEIVRENERTVRRWMKRYLAEETGIRVEAETVRQHLAKHDIVLRRPQHTISSPDPEYEVKKRRSRTHETT